MISSPHSSIPAVVIIGGGPAGLMAAETLSSNGVPVAVYDAMPSVGRKFLLAGKGGMNITHSEPYTDFLLRYGSHANDMGPLLQEFGPDAVRKWVKNLGIETFIGSSGRVFPSDMKAAPLLRAWLHRLRLAGVRFHMRHRWTGWNAEGDCSFSTPDGVLTVRANVILLALGGGSWARMGSDGAWVPLLASRKISVSPLLPSNCGFNVEWSDYFKERFAGHHLKSVAIALPDLNDDVHQTPPSNNQNIPFYKQGEFVISADGVEGSLIYAISARLRDHIGRHGSVRFHLDLLPDWSHERVLTEVTHPRGSRSWSSHLQSRLGLKGVKVGLLRECASTAFTDATKLALAIKALPISLVSARPIDEAISSAGGVMFNEVDKNMMLRAIPGVFCAGEMLDWEAPTGGYLLTACFASGRKAGLGVLDWLKK
ncbi:TIGR03862 family flavoprotein [Glaciimonas sp. Gout2]|uniref:TIGR03862 family flavoprotein n=1 Tax=unclassified Glaciimonas TaxID=2644401 RepID=UPI002AB48BC8|nr:MULTISPECIES: TIGR03862 family flavoprotein [unclassified Glaciimonas]MDY7548471.1 TIGR03862 family flavoprotein [Glaciimonas sp. CA11.2]MEB0010381.1 TIGR03862 family flavoprotein [Glaciimonas sp. Cout2]MEB0084865.1 TIGR03862 family flavoprotein [Glaciimonas sp. Gout2]